MLASASVFKATGVLSDTWHITGTQGCFFLNIPFFSDVNGQSLQPLVGAPSIFETGGWQTVAQFTVSNGDQYTWHFRSDINGVAEPSTWAMMLIGFAGIGFAAYRRARTANAAVPA
jgi:PEP-CTERM motif-containing protein